MEEPILIIGAGPVGLSLATALTRLEIPVVIFEEAQSIAQEIRASTFHAATMEKMEEWGVIDAVLAKGYRVDRMQFWDRNENRVVGDFHFNSIAKDTNFPFRLQCPQHVYAETLLKKLINNPLFSIKFNHKFLACKELNDSICAEFETASKISSYSGRLLCGADGANSALRRWLKLGFEGMTYEDKFLLVGTNLDLSEYFPKIAPVCYFFDPDEWVIILQLNGVLRLVFQVKEGQDPDNELHDFNIQNRVWNLLGKQVNFPIMHKSIYRVHQRVAESFRVGRSILLGDAAHINNPASGMGMNSGILDAACLSEKISQYIQSKNDSILEEYNVLRRDYAIEKIKSYSRQRYLDLSRNDDASRRIRNHKYEKICLDKALTRDFLLQSAMLEHRI